MARKNKMDAIINSSLEQKTALYWNLSKAFKRGEGPKAKISTVEALNNCGALWSCLASHRHLAGKTTELRDEIVCGRKRTKKKPDNIVHLLIANKHN